MKKIKLIVGLIVSMFLAVVGIQAQTSLAPVFTDHMVLQQNTDAPIWGWGDAGSTLKIVGSWAPQDTTTVVVKGDGRWETKIKTTSAGGPFTLTVFGRSTCILKDIMLGEVWLCSGQSNMEWTAMHNINNAAEEIGNANYPNIRFFHIPRRGADTPQSSCEASWAVCTPDVMRNTSAVGYFFGRKLQKDLNVPIGLIVAAWGGTHAEVWTPEELIKANPTLDAVKPKGEDKWRPTKVGVLYNQMIHPVVPFALSGAIWYQGESNRENASTYGLLMKTMIEGWRKEFKKDLPFYQVQIAPFDYNDPTALSAIVRENQEWAARNVPNTGMVVVSDLVDNIKDIHPIDKQNVGLRLANMALGKVYKRIETGYQSPVFKSMEINKDKAIISFMYADGGLVCRDKQVIGFKIAGEDGNFHPAKAEIKNNTIVVSSPKVKNPTVVRYCFDDTTMGNVFSKDGLPLAPFRTDRGW